MIQNKNRKLSRINISRLIGNAWGKAATVANATSGFRACGIYPYNPQAIPEHFFSISDASISAASANKALPSTSNHSNLTPGPNKAQPSTSFSPGHTDMGVSDMSTDSQTSNEASEVSLNLEEKETPSKFLREDNPIPLIPNTIPKRKQHALELTSPENRVKRRVFSEKKKQAQDKKDKRKKPSENEKKIRRKPALNKLKENKMYQVRLRRKLNHILAPLKTYLMTLMITALNVANTTTSPNLGLTGFNVKHVVNGYMKPARTTQTCVIFVPRKNVNFLLGAYFTSFGQIRPKCFF
ncbi:unnamed protein product [Acanthoscelides obtectus]|uniref:Uncharacterized protein n=1 Tax=Acanthoscelides obtectus TaxID=200917 RepID=A0A9P0P901_ACAOB|nr:unnamed protein product [Acanthoscelides obtectus]CAK1633404.1 hypothetical protein AOBTE_LOCUS8106 [Acanthoscelides obtectus]